MARWTPTFALALLCSLPACVTPVPDDDPTPAGPFVPVPWEAGQPPLDRTVAGQRELRSIVHLHSHWSHDACDGDPQPLGIPDELCLADLRAALCTNRIDVALITDHPAHAEEADYQTLLLLRGDDEAVLGAEGSPVANRMSCDNGHSVLWMPGIESGQQMPIGLTRHARAGAYSEQTPEAVADLRAAGAVPWMAHIEQRTVESIAPLGLAGMEIYQLHANLGPDIREEALGLDPFSWLADTLPFLTQDDDDPDPPQADLAPLAFIVPIEPAIRVVEQLGLDQHFGVSGGTDAHQNVLEAPANDGERGDSYRRMTRWFNTRLRIEGELTPEHVHDALEKGRTHVVHEVFGQPSRFDFYAIDGVTRTEMGSEVTLGPGLHLLVDVPSLDPASPRGEDPPEITARLFGFDGGERELLAEAAEGRIDLPVDHAGVYRVEVWITPHHLRPYLGSVADRFVDMPVPWIWSGLIFVR